MKTFRAVIALAVVLGWVLLAGSPARAGGWAVTLVDPLPDRVEAGRTYTVGFWVLQHGSHPFFGGELDPVGLKLVDAKGATTEFPGVALREAAHYAASVVVPGPGTWKVYGIQGPFADYLVGTLTVPGGLAVLPVPQPMPVEQGTQFWGTVRPPDATIDPARPLIEDPVPVRAEASDAPAARAEDPGPGGAVVAAGAVAAGVVLVGAAGAAAFLRGRRRRTTSPAG
jgi:hypothetical protein